MAREKTPEENAADNERKQLVEEKKNLKKEHISYNSKLNLLYLKKDVDPKWRLVALDAILLFFMNLFFTIVWIFISQIINNDSIKKICEISYIFLFLIIGTIPIIKFNLNKK